jgi:hypothetical protein
LWGQKPSQEFLVEFVEARWYGLDCLAVNRWFDGVFLGLERRPSVSRAAELRFRAAMAVPESYRIDESRNPLQAVSISVDYWMSHA